MDGTIHGNVAIMDGVHHLGIALNQVAGDHFGASDIVRANTAAAVCKQAKFGQGA